MTDFKLINQLQESIEDRGILKAIFVTGAPGAGKSYTIKQITDGQIKPMVVNSDIMYDFLRRQGKTTGVGPEAWASVRDTVIRTTQGQLANRINSMLPLFIDSTSADPGAILRRKGILEAFGYDVGLLWIDADVETSIRRAKQREEEEGRHVTPEFIKAVHERAQESKKFLESRFDWAQQLQNNDGELSDEVIRKAYLRTSNFYNQPVQNPIGQRILRQLKDERQKYLVPTAFSREELQHLTTAWYKR